MISSHASFQTLSQNIKPYSHKIEKTVVAKAIKTSVSESSVSNELKVQLRGKADSIEKLIGFLEDITWLDIPDDQTRNAILELIQIAKQYYEKEEAFSASFRAGQHNADLNLFLLALEDLSETIQDVESAIITLPKLDGFKEIFDELSRL